MPVVDVGLFQWWFCFVGLFDLVDVRCWMWVWDMGLFGLVDMGLCRSL